MPTLPPLLPGGSRDPSVATGQIDERGCDVGDDLIVVDVTGYGYDRRAGGVVLGVEAPDVLGDGCPDGFALTCRITAEAVVGEQLAGERAQGDVIWRVVVHRQLLEDHLTLALDVLVGERRPRQHVAEQLDADAAVAGRSRQ